MMIEVTLTTFELAVLEASRQLPVLVDFWAPWCGPCRALGPVLERLETAYAGRFKLVKVNSDENPELSQRYMVRSIPYVLAFVDGNPTDGFIGALPEIQVRAFLDRLLPGPAESERRRAHQLIGQGEFTGAIAALRAALRIEPDHDEDKLDLADVLLNRLRCATDAQRIADADLALSAVSARAQREARYGSLTRRLKTLREAATLPALATLEAAVSAQPDDLKARTALASKHIARGELEPALEQLLEVIRRDRNYDQGAARRTFLSVLELAADRPTLVTDYRKKLALLLNG
jgi:putative thioredoxin